MALFDEVKKYLRIDASDTGFDGEIQDLIDAAQMDLIEVGVDTLIVHAVSIDPLIKRAIVTYAKANFGYESDSADQLNESYLKIKIFLMNNPDYMAVVP